MAVKELAFEAEARASLLVGVEKLVMEMRFAHRDEMVAAVDEALRSRLTLAEHLGQTIPVIKRRVLALMENIGS